MKRLRGLQPLRLILARWRTSEVERIALKKRVRELEAEAAREAACPR